MRPHLLYLASFGVSSRDVLNKKKLCPFGLHFIRLSGHCPIGIVVQPLDCLFCT